MCTEYFFEGRQGILHPILMKVVKRKSSFAASLFLSSTRLTVICMLKRCCLVVVSAPRGRVSSRRRRCSMMINAMMASSSSSSSGENRKAGVASNEEMRAFLARHAGGKVTVVDARNPDFSMEPGDEQFGGPGKQFPIENCGTRGRPNAINLPFSREKKEVSGFDRSALHDAEKDAPIITHCGGGGRGQKSKEWLEKKGFTNVINGGGPQVTELWEMFGDL